MGTVKRQYKQISNAYAGHVTDLIKQVEDLKKEIELNDVKHEKELLVKDNEMLKKEKEILVKDLLVKEKENELLKKDLEMNKMRNELLLLKQK